MKIIRRLSGVLRVIGIVLICVFLVLALYNLINVGSGWSGMENRMAAVGARIGILDRLGFDDAYFTALSQAFAARKEDAETVRAKIAPNLRHYFDLQRQAVAEKRTAEQNAVWSWLDELKSADFAARADALEEMAESQELEEAFEYIDSFTAAPKSGKLAKLKAASLKPWFEEYYAAFAKEQGEAAGSWHDFVLVVRDMLRAHTEAGNTVKDVKAWMTGDFSREDYSARLAALEKSEAGLSNNLLVDLSELCERREAGERTDVRALIADTAAGIAARYEKEDLGGLPALLAVLRPLVEDPAFNGSWSEVAAAMRSYVDSGALTEQEDFEAKYLDGLIAEADKRAAIPIMAEFWAVTAKYLQILLAGILLVLLAKLIILLQNRSLLAQMKETGIAEDPDVLLRVSHLKQYFRSGDYVNRAVDDVSFFIRRGEVFGLVGESGCGKTTTGRTIINLYDPTEGDVYFNGLRVSSTLNGLPVLRRVLRQEYRAEAGRLRRERPEGWRERKAQLRAAYREHLRQAETNAMTSFVEKSKANQKYREKRQADLKAACDAEIGSLSGEAARERIRRFETESRAAAKDNVMTRMQMIFQDPIASINPRMTVREIIAEGLVIRGITDKEYINRRVDEMLELVGLVREHADRYPHEFSGGQRQRIGIARAIVMEPELIIADEPISALDVSIQAQVINLLNDLRNRMGLTILFIAHNLSVVKYFSDRIAVMYFGKIVELADSDELFAHPLHPYTKSLLSAIPYPDPHYEKNRKRVEYNPAEAHDYTKDQPTLRELKPGHWVQCNDAEAEAYLRELAR